MSRRWPFYIAVLGCLATGPATAAEIGAKIGSQSLSVRSTLRRMSALRLVHVESIVAGPRNALTMRWAIGAAPARAAATCAPLQPRAELISLASLLRALNEPLSAAQLADVTGTSKGHLYRTLPLLKAAGLTRIAEWHVRLHGGPPVALYARGTGPDATRPAPLPRALIQKRSRDARQSREHQREVSRALCGFAGAAA